MGLFDNFPYTNFHELNLDWILKVLKDIETTIDQFVSLNIIKYADPIQWDIVRQYPKNTIVIDPVSGTAYISVDNVPQGVALSNTDYWSVVFDLGRFITLASQNFAVSYEPVLTTTATMPTVEGGWVVWNSLLYEALNDIHVGDAYVEDGNIKKTPVEVFFNRLKAELNTEILNRISADNALGGMIDQEILDRQAADTALGGRIDQEILDRQTADTALGGRIDQEILDRQAVDTALGGRIDQEILDRQAADIALRNSINGLNRVYKNINEMLADTELGVGKCAICLNPYESRWEITAATTPDLTNRTLSNGLNAKLLNNIPINIGALKTYNTNDDISADLSFLISSGYKDLIIPAGIYRCSITVPANTSIRGAGKTLTGLIPVNHGSCLNLDGDYITLSDFGINDVTPYTGYGIVVNQSLGCSNASFKNIKIENLKQGFLATSSMIWCEFYNCDFIGCLDNGFIITSPTAYFNNNAFYSCKFNNNVNNGIVIDLAEVHDYATVFYSCNIEYNAIDRFGVTHLTDNAVKNTGFTSFIGCYFEGNGSSNTDSTIQNFDLLNLEGCIFVNERIVVNNTNASITNFIGCKQYQCVGYVTSTSNVNQFGNNFTIS